LSIETRSQIIFVLGLHVIGEQIIEKLRLRVKEMGFSLR